MAQLIRSRRDAQTMTELDWTKVLLKRRKKQRDSGVVDESQTNHLSAVKESWYIASELRKIYHEDGQDHDSTTSDPVINDLRSLTHLICIELSVRVCFMPSDMSSSWLTTSHFLSKTTTRSGRWRWNLDLEFRIWNKNSSGSLGTRYAPPKSEIW